jgi:hypothetical protein
VLPPVPIINTQPISRAALQGSTITPAFSVVATTFSQQTNYQWYSNGVAIAGQTNRTLNLANVQAGSFTPNTFSVTVSDGFNSPGTSSVQVQLTHPGSPSITNSVAGTTLTMTFFSSFGPAYVVEYKTNLLDAAWKPLKTNAGTEGTITVTDSLSAAPTRFYRVRLQ